MADEPLIRSVNPPPRIKDAPKRKDANNRRKPPAGKKERREKNRRHIIDTYA